MDDSEYLVPPQNSFAIAFVGCVYYAVICFMTPHLQPTHLVVLMQSSCVFSSIMMFFFKLIGWSWIRTCQLLLGLTSLVLILYSSLSRLMASVSLFVSRRTCCTVVLVATSLFVVAVLLNSYTIALSTHTLLQYVCACCSVDGQPSLQSQFEYHVYKIQFPLAFVVVFVFYSIRNPIHIQFVDMFTFFDTVFTGFLRTFVHSWVMRLLAGLTRRNGFFLLPILSADCCTTRATRIWFSSVMPCTRASCRAR